MSLFKIISGGGTDDSNIVGGCFLSHGGVGVCGDGLTSKPAKRDQGLGKEQREVRHQGNLFNYREEELLRSGKITRKLVSVE